MLDKLVKIVVISFILRKSTSRVSMDFTPEESAWEMKLVMGSMATTRGFTSLTIL